MVEYNSIDFVEISKIFSTQPAFFFGTTPFDISLFNEQQRVAFLCVLVGLYWSDHRDTHRHGNELAEGSLFLVEEARKSHYTSGAIRNTSQHTYRHV